MSVPKRRDTDTGIIWCAGVKADGRPCNNRKDVGRYPPEHWLCYLHEDQG